MPINAEIQDFDNNLRPRHGFLALRKRSADHPMAMFAIIASVAFASMVIVPTSGTAFASLGPVAGPAVKQAEGNRTTAKTDRMPTSETDIACRGQAWGSESTGCLAVIEKESGKGEMRKIRVIADANGPSATPNVF